MTGDLCFVDLDGVLADLHGPLARLFDRRVEDWPRGEDDVGAAFTAMPIHPDPELEEGEGDIFGAQRLALAQTQAARDGVIWGHPDVCAARFWRELSELPWADELLERLDRHFGRERVVILTSPIRAPDCLAGKAEWVARHCRGRGFLIGRPKSACAGRGRYLVDDRPREIEQWILRGGAAALLLPRPWNNEPSEPLDAVDDWLARLRRADARRAIA